MLLLVLNLVDEVLEHLLVGAGLDPLVDLLLFLVLLLNLLQVELDLLLQQLVVVLGVRLSWLELHLFELRWLLEERSVQLSALGCEGVGALPLLLDLRLFFRGVGGEVGGEGLVLLDGVDERLLGLVLPLEVGVLVLLELDLLEGQVVRYGLAHELEALVGDEAEVDALNVLVGVAGLQNAEEAVLLEEDVLEVDLFDWVLWVLD
mmetsp:Transcript_1043/g.1911  ORF Transcript_1043/g.1911 Transcript_1043/m.1911 type:complete len:205 (+) Transcript_1043:245-859(+)